MTNHLCVQCRHYVGTATPNGTCAKLHCPVWSRRPQCADPINDGFEPLDTLGNRMRNARNLAGLSRDEVCAEMEISGRTLQNWEADVNVPAKAMQKLFYFICESKNKKFS